MPSPVELDEEKASNRTSEKKASEQGRSTAVCKCERFKPTAISQTDYASNVQMENGESLTKSSDDGLKGKEEQNPFIVDMGGKGENIVTFSCVRCLCLAHRSNEDDKDSRKRQKQTKRCVCWTIIISVIVSLSIIAGLSYLTYKVVGTKDLNSQNSVGSDKDNDDESEGPHVHTYRTRIHRLGNKLVHTYKTFVHKGPPKTVVTKFALDTFSLHQTNSIVLPWKVKDLETSSGVTYQADSNTVTVMESGVYLILLTLSMETNGYPKSTMLSVHPCLKYNEDREYCQRLVIPSGMATPVYLEDVAKFKAHDKIKVTVPQKEYIYSSALYNTLTFVRLNHDH